jgi:hypothetical protein
MTEIYVAFSKTLAEWGGDVGLTKHLYLVAAAEDGVEAAIEALNQQRVAGVDDWKLIKKAPAKGTDQSRATEQLARKERMVDPGYYPRLKGARGIFKVKLQNVEHSRLVKRALAAEQEKVSKLKPADIAQYLIENALRSADSAWSDVV